MFDYGGSKPGEHGGKGETADDTLHVQEQVLGPSQGETGEEGSKELQVYERRTWKVFICHVPQPGSSPPPPDQGNLPSSDLHLPIAHKKGVRTCAQHPISNFVSYDHLPFKTNVFALSLFSISITCNVSETLTQKPWREAMIEEMTALEKNGTWELVDLPRGKTTVGCRWVFTVKLKPNGTVDKYKARLVAKGYA